MMFVRNCLNAEGQTHPRAVLGRSPALEKLAMIQQVELLAGIQPAKGGSMGLQKGE